MVEFALVAPVAFLLLLGIIVLGIVVTNQIALTQAVRDGSRAAALCGSTMNGANPATLPDGTACTTGNITTYINGKLGVVSPTLKGTETYTVYNNAGTVVAGPSTADTTVASCSVSNQQPYTVEVSVTYQQPLYLPLIGNIFGNGATNTRTINAKGEATCEQ